MKSQGLTIKLLLYLRMCSRHNADRSLQVLDPFLLACIHTVEGCFVVRCDVVRIGRLMPTVWRNTVRDSALLQSW